MNKFLSRSTYYNITLPFQLKNLTKAYLMKMNRNKTNTNAKSKKLLVPPEMSNEIFYKPK